MIFSFLAYVITGDVGDRTSLPTGEGDRNAQRRAGQAGVVTDLGARLQADVVQAPQELLHGYPHVHAGEIRPDAPVRSGAEGQVPVALAPDVERVRVRELGAVPVGRGPVDQHLVPLPDLLAAELDVAHRRAGHGDERRVEPEQFLDGVRDA